MLGIYKNKHGFTVVELLIVIVVIVLLAALGFAGYRGAQSRAYHTEAMNDAENIADKLEIAYLDNKKYPQDLSELGDYKKSPGTSMTYQSNGDSYCLQVSSTNASTKTYTIRDDKNIVEGTCQGWVPSGGVATLDPPVATISSITTSSIGVSWAAVSGATGYVVKYGTTSPTTTASCSASPCSITGLPADTNYYISVTATSSGKSTTSAVVNALTRIPAPAAASVTYTKSTVKLSGGFMNRRYTVTASGGACSMGSTEWQINVSAVGYNSSWPWQSSNTKIVDIPEDGFYSPDDVTIYAKPRCISGSNITNGNTATAISGTGGVNN